MRNIGKAQRGVMAREKEIRFGGVHIDLIGPADLAHNKKAKDAAIDFLRTEILASRDWLKDCGKIDPVLKWFKLRASRTCVIYRCPTCSRHRRTHRATKENRV